MQKNGEKKYLKNSDHKKEKVKYKKEESGIVKTCLEYLSLMGYIAIRNNSGLVIFDSNNKKRAIKLGTAGSPDIIACSPKGQFVAIECKSSKGRLTEKQKEFLKKVEKLGGKSLVVKSIDDLINNL